MTFVKIDDTKFSFLTEELGGIALRSLIQKSGRKRVIFVEGYDDEAIYNIIFSDLLSNILFIDVSFKEESDGSSGGCDKVKKTLHAFVENIKDEKRFYGVIDRDLKGGAKIKEEEECSIYDKRLFIFKEKYTMENYFISHKILLEFIKGRAIYHGKKLLPCKDELKLQEIIDSIYKNLAYLCAGNLTIMYFNKRKFNKENKGKPFLEKTIRVKEVRSRLFQILKEVDKSDVLLKFKKFNEFIKSNPKNTDKFLSAKDYFSVCFNNSIKLHFNVGLQINNHRPELARIFKDQGLSDEWNKIPSFVGLV